jgi:hypothetical protein
MKIKFFLNGSFPVYPAFRAYLVYLNFRVSQGHRRVRKHQQLLRQRLFPNSNRRQHLL